MRASEKEIKDSKDWPIGIEQLTPSGTNSTHFTKCCGVAICTDQSCCPSCGRYVVGWDAENVAKARWLYATRHWDRRSKAQ